MRSSKLDGTPLHRGANIFVLPHLSLTLYSGVLFEPPYFIQKTAPINRVGFFTSTPCIIYEAN